MDQLNVDFSGKECHCGSIPPLNPDNKHLGSAHASVVPSLGWTVGSEDVILFMLIMTNSTKNPKRVKLNPLTSTSSDEEESKTIWNDSDSYPSFLVVEPVDNDRPIKHIFDVQYFWQWWKLSIHQRNSTVGLCWLRLRKSNNM